LTIPEARQRLEVAGLPFVFFADASTDRGSVLYHRYDGHYGLITPAQ
jgi:Sigma 54 modulation/S30EA ribosomal protein C terminus